MRTKLLTKKDKENEVDYTNNNIVKIEKLKTASATFKNS